MYECGQLPRPVHPALSEGSLRKSILEVTLSAMLPDEQLDPEQIRIFQAMSGERRLQLAERLYWSARKLKRAGLRLQHPEWAEERLDQEVRRLFLHART
jgi:hypothetical protein